MNKSKNEKEVAQKRSRTSNAKLNKITTGIIGVLALAGGIYGVLTGIKDIPLLALMAGIIILAIALVEFFAMLSGKKSKSQFAFSLIRVGTGILLAVLLIVNREQNMAWPLILLSIYTIGRGILEILNAIVFVNDKTEKTFWLVCGAAGCLLGIIALNSGGFADKTDFFRIFCIFLSVYGLTALTSLVYGTKKH